jgi:hypothetical protein
MTWTKFSARTRARFAADGQNVLALGYVFQWQHGQVVPVLPAGKPGISPIESNRPAWNTAG